MNALISGSFDPITLGHVNIIERASCMFEKIIVAVMNNDSAKYDPRLTSKTNMFDFNERLDMVKLSTSHIKNVECVYHSGMLIDACDIYDISAVVRGVRNADDFEYEMIHAVWNREHNRRADTLFMPADKKFDSVSSSRAKCLISEGRYDELHGIISDGAIKYIKEHAKMPNGEIPRGL